MEHRSLRSLDENAESTRDRVRHGEEIDGHAAQRDMGTIVDLTELGCTDAELGEFALHKAQGELAGENGDLIVEVLQQIRQRTGVVLMAMGDDDAAKLILVLEDIGVVGKDEVDARLRIVGKHQACVDKNHIGTALENGHVLADAVKTSQGNNPERCSVLFCCRHMVCEILSSEPK